MIIKNIDTGKTIKDVNIAKPGFLNINLSSELWNQVLKSSITLSLNFGKENLGKAKKINLIYQDYQLKKNLVKISKFVDIKKSQKNFLVRRLKIFLNIKYSVLKCNKFFIFFRNHISARDSFLQLY